jgi:nitronate monooxygenase
MKLTELLSIKYPMIMAPMFLVTNEKMCVEAMNSGIAAAIPALNWRKLEQMEAGINSIKKQSSGVFGVNLIVNKSNPLYLKQLEVCLKTSVDFIITSLGKPDRVIERCKPLGIKVFCDVVDVDHAQKVEALGADAVIAVNNRAGGHAGSFGPAELYSRLKQKIHIPIIAAGGVGNHESFSEMMEIGFSGVSVGSIFIACEESDISQDYKEACVSYGADDIVMSTKISGTPCTVIQTPYVQKVGTKQNPFERFLSKNKKLKKWVKMLTYVKGMKSIEKAAFSSSYKTVWVAGPSIEYSKKIKSVKDIVKSLVVDTR